jgi:myo-inositol-1(or 4)-monophosphatase
VVSVPMGSRKQGLAKGELRALRDVAIEAARKAANIQRAAIDRPHRVSFKGLRDIVTEVDRACERVIVETVSSHFPEHGFLLEESPFEATSSPYLWVVDPLDGTMNFSHGVPHFCCSIALEHCGLPQVGVVVDPVRNEEFTAVRGQGARLNGKPIRTSGESRLLYCLLATGFPNDLDNASDTNLAKFTRMLRYAQGIRRTGVAALDLCYVAAGRFDGYWITKLEHWDAAAGILIVEEAGGRVTDLYGNPADSSTRHLVVSNGKIHKRMMEILHVSRDRGRHRRPPGRQAY